MGFFINEITYELKQHINLSEKAWDVIYNDMNSFYGEKNKQSFSGFLNSIFYHYYQDAMGSIGIRSEKYREDLLALVQKQSAVLANEHDLDRIISLLVKEYENKLLEKAYAYPKGVGKKFRVNRQNVEILRESSASSFYHDSIGSYMKAVFEEYTALSQAERERVLFKETIDACQFAIAKRNKLKVSLQQRLSANNSESYTRKFYITPYTVATDKNGLFNYLVGISEEIKGDGSLGEKRISSFRISRIQKISVMSSMSGFLSHQKIEEINKEISEKSLPYMAGDLISVEVAFTAKGLELFDRQLYLRPAAFEKIDASTYVFHCTELQAIHYFFKFGRDAFIQKPQYLQEKFKSYYREAFEAYSRDEQND